MTRFKTITLAQKPYPICFNNNCIANYCEQQGISIADMDAMLQNMTMKGLLWMYLYALQEGHRLAKLPKPFTMTVEDIGDIADEDSDAMERLAEAMNDSYPKADKDVAKTDTVKSAKKK